MDISTIYLSTTYLSTAYFSVETVYVKGCLFVKRRIHKKNRLQ
ncbi:hypothetical protein YPPY47_0300 [Yersinia pestis PY-47]|uniref:Uncharacterized protein n=1 Tax=Yersinia pestis PY-08 TaxID=992134 RepID=A0AB72ZRG6_YERPE|nr:hypothetical protein YPPY06_0247 [Yersinia pestis PY-06]EIR24894.1 hypothetical protein YPPY08_0256 [Yersinia pestis PY-08]EIR83153.1 hypothetical protein YPPY34_0253 [Yersinia pestis PY-34]EIS11333.1 hypothetical protein YPPY47_0300 [Yersinia pestis PY-47]EIS23732.1 hypothetical protein YPPY52_0216 [Yersinia pestis PY-52]EIS37655.1 hypothetical protein YPPY56_0254 [Yersinia pestis PY-56]EIS81713.1 hypothetical protein YPPY71_0182 [Yersinia pestis PY-71]EIT07913.1 hypothetical protein YPP